MVCLGCDLIASCGWIFLIQEIYGVKTLSRVLTATRPFVCLRATV